MFSVQLRAWDSVGLKWRSYLNTEHSSYAVRSVARTWVEPMKHVLVGLSLFVCMGLLAAHQAPPQKSKALPAVPKEDSVSTIRFNNTPQAIAGASGDVISVSVSADGSRIACTGGSFNPASGFLSVIETQTKKEILSLRLPRSFNSVSISPDGKFVAATGQSGELKLLEVESGKTLFYKKLDTQTQLAFTADGMSLATVTQGKMVQLWEVPTGEEQTKFRGATVPLRSIAISPDGKKLAAAGGEQQKKGEANGAIFVWDIVSQRLLHKLESDAPVPITSIAFSSDSKLIAGSSADLQVRVWELANAQLKTSWMVRQQLFGIAFSPSGTLAGATGNGSIILWDGATGLEQGTLFRHLGACRCVAFLDKGKKLVSGANSRSLKLWDVAAKKELTTLHQDESEEETAVPLAMAATADGSLIAQTTEDRGIILRDGKTGVVKGILKGHDEAVMCAVFSPNGKTLATGSTDKTIKLWDVETAKELATLKGHKNWVFALAFSHDGKTLVSGAYDKTVKLWDVNSGKEQGTIEAHRGAVRAVAFCPDDKIIASGGSDRLVKLWNVTDRELKSSLKGHESAVRCLSFNSNGKVLASGGEDGSVKFWNPETGKEINSAKKASEAEVTALAFAGERTLISACADGTIFQWDSTTGEMIGALAGHSGGVSGLAVVADGTELISTGADGILKRFRQDGAGPIRLFAGHTGVIQCVSFSPDGQRFVSCGNWPEGDKTLRIWNVQKGTEVMKIDVPAQAAMVLYSPNGKHIASTCGNGNIYLWDAKTGEQVRIFKGHQSGVGGLAFNGDGSRILSSSVDKTARVWETATGREVQKFTGHTDMIRRVAFHPDGKHALSASRDGFVRMWEIETAKEVKRFKSSGKWADSLAISKDGMFLAVGGSTILVFEIESGKLHSECTGHQFGITHVAFSDDGKKVLSASYDFSARLWDRETGKELYKFRGHREFLWMASFSPDGKWVLTGGGGFNAGDEKYDKGTDHTIRLWKMPDEKTISDFSAEN